MSNKKKRNGTSGQRTVVVHTERKLLTFCLEPSRAAAMRQDFSSVRFCLFLFTFRRDQCYPFDPAMVFVCVCVFTKLIFLVFFRDLKALCCSAASFSVGFQLGKRGFSSSLAHFLPRFFSVSFFEQLAFGAGKTLTFA